MYSMVKTIKKGSVTDICLSFHSRCGPEGIKTACTDTNNTVCNKKSGGVVKFSVTAFEINHDDISIFLCQHTLHCLSEGLQPGEIAGIVVGVLVFLAALLGGVVVYRWSEYFFLLSFCNI